MQRRESPPVHGRGAQSALVPQRFGLLSREADGDWRDAALAVDGPGPKLRTTVTEEHPRTIVSFNLSPDIPFDRSLNAYRGCEHGCIYCFARPSHAFHDLSPGIDFETRLFAKPGAAALLRRTFAGRGYKPRPLAMGTNTDPYQPIEARYRITRQVLEVCLEARHPVTITTKSARVLDDIDLLRDLAGLGLVGVGISVTSLDPVVSGKLEPRASSPARRLAALGTLVAAGVPAHCGVAPVIPAITDHDLEAIVAQAGKLGVRSASFIIVRLPHEVAPLFREWLATHFPERGDKVMAIIRSIRNGKDNEGDFFARMNPQGVWADLLRKRFTLACRRAGIGNERPMLRTDRFRPPGLDGQLSLL